MKVKNRRVSANLIDGRNLTGPHYSKAEAQRERAFNPGAEEKKVRFQNKEKNRIIKDGYPGAKVLQDRKLKILNQPTPSSKKGIPTFTKKKGKS